MKIFDRVHDIILYPKVTWQTIKEENIPVKELVVNYAAPLALIPVVSALIGKTLVGIPMLEVGRVPFVISLLQGIFNYLISLAMIFIVAWAVNLLAPVFEAKSDYDKAVKLTIYSFTPVWIVGIFFLLPWLGMILSLLGLYWIYLFAVGLPEVLETPGRKVFFYTLAVIFATFLITIILSLMVSLIIAPMHMHLLAT